MSFILRAVARFANMLNFTLLITVGNLSEAKIQIWLVAKQEVWNGEIINCFSIYMCQTLSTDIS